MKELSERRISSILHESISKVLNERFDYDGYSASEYDDMYDATELADIESKKFLVDLGNGETISAVVSFKYNDAHDLIDYDIEDFEQSEFLDDDEVMARIEAFIEDNI